jgi:dihydropteroate synthase
MKNKQKTKPLVQIISSSAKRFSRDAVTLKMKELGVDPVGIKWMADKALFWVLEISELRPEAANILKQEMLSRGGEVALPKGALDLTNKACRVLVMGTTKQFQELIDKCKIHQFGLPDLAIQMKTALENYSNLPAPIKIGKKNFVFGQKTYVMGVVNVTPDSFSDGGRFFDPKNAIEHALNLIEAGADIIDIGGESSRPGAKRLSAKEELSRVLPVIKALRKRSQVPISIDTYKAAVAEEAIKVGANLINDISAFNLDPKLAKIAAKYKVPVVLMHMKGSPGNMQTDPRYENLFDELSKYFLKSIAFATSCGILPSKIIIDPGIGFGKTVEHNLALINNLDRLKLFGKPILVGTSRKSFIGKILKADPDQRMEGTAASVAVSIVRGANFVRVHDVSEMKRVVAITDAICKNQI